jgi:cyclin G-associated kinase
MFKSAMGYLGGMTAGAIAGDLPGIIPDPIDDALVGSIVDVAGHKIAVKRRIGEGGFAFVYEAEDINDSSKKYALKRLLAMDSEKQQQIVKEISLMKMLSGHGNIVGFLSAAEAKGVSQKGCDEFLVLMEFCPTNLSEIMSKRHCRPYPPATVAGIFAQITSAVAKMHRSQPAIVHRDLKLENLLVDATGKVVKLCDFGSATTEKFTPDENWTMSQRNNLEVSKMSYTWMI